jgi:ataxia telangiectasia mutated family protein
VQRYSEAVNLVRFVAERSCRLLSRKPFMSLFTHLTTLLAGDRRIDDRIAVPYIKALRTLLSFPPHLENLDPTGWRMIMGVCFMALLGDPISLDDEAWGEDLEMDVDDDGQQGYQLASSISTELLSLVPILLSSTRAPLIPDPPAVDDTRVSPPALGCSILFKLSRYIRQLPVQNISIDAIRSINLVLAELEINSKKDFTLASLQLFPQLVMVWTSRSDLAIRETTLVALRTMLPYVTHESVTDESKEAVRDAMSKLVDSIAKEGRSGIRPLDLAALRLDSRPNPAKGPFQLTGVTVSYPPIVKTNVQAGFGFDASQALSWAAIELYADCCRETSTRPTFSVTQRRKRPRTEGSVDKLLDLITSIGEQRHTRLLASQVVVFLVGKHWATLTESRMDLRRKLLELLEEKNVEIQSWGFIGLSCLATVDDSLQEQSRNKLWTHAVRKAAVEGVSRAACHAANVLLNSGKIDHAQSVKSIKAALSDVQGPTSITDASCAFLASCLATMRADVGLYSANFEDKVLDWFDEAFKGETAIKSRIGSATPSNKLDLINAICNFTGSGIADVSVTEHLPESPVVTRILQESETAPIRDVILHGIFPALPETLERQAADPSSSQAETIESLDMLGSRPKKLSKTLQNAVRAVHAELTASDRPTHLMTSERLRKGIDLVVLVLAFEATIQSNGYQSDPAVCLEPAAKLLQLLVKHLNVLDKVPQQLLVWRGFPPIYFKPTMHSAKWPILLKPDVASGIRRDILSPTKYSSHYDEEEVSANSPRDKLLAIIWGREEVRNGRESWLTSDTSCTGRGR